MTRPDAPRLVRRLQGFGTTVFAEMTALAVEHDALNLGQGFPDEDPPDSVVAAAAAALREGHNQYAPGPGVVPLRRAVAAHQERFHGLAYDPDDEVTVTFGATEAIAAAVLALTEPGDEVLVLEPTYDSYTAVIAMAGGTEVRVPLRPPAFTFDAEAFAAAVGPRTRLVVLNSPHNPTGTVLRPEDLDAVARVCLDHDLVVVTDEVYEHLVYEGRHVPLATRPGMRERTITVSSAGKTFSCTGWKVGWACAPAPLSRAVRTTKQFLSFAGGTPLQHAVAHGLELGDEVFAAVAATHRRRRDLLCAGLEALGVPLTRPGGAYFVVADLAPLGHDDAEVFCRTAPAAIGVAAVPVSAFVVDPEPVRSLVRFAFCKPDAVLEQAVQRLGVGLVARSAS